MPLYKRRYAPRRRFIRKRRLVARVPRRPRAWQRGVIGPPRPSYNFKRTWYNENYFSTGSAGVPTLAGLSFNLSSMPNASEFSNLFDSYRINKIVVKIIPKITETSTVLASTGNSALPQIHSALDFNDSIAPTSLAQLTQYSTHKMTRGNMVHTRVFTPCVELSANATANTAPKSYQWLDTSHLDIAHLGMKLYIPTLGTQTVIYYDYSVTMYFSCKNTI